MDGSTERARAPNSRVCVRTATATAPRFPPLIGSGANVGDRQYIEHYVFRFCMFRASGASKAGSMAGSWVCTCACVPLLYRVNMVQLYVLGPRIPSRHVGRCARDCAREPPAIPASFAAHSRGGRAVRAVPHAWWLHALPLRYFAEDLFTWSWRRGRRT